jgi:hypothetical protein
MSNEHNPISRKIDHLRELWISETGKNPGYSLARWLMLPDDIDLLVGFLKLESTSYGQLPEVFVILLTPFSSGESFPSELVKDWINMYKIEKKKNNADQYSWDYTPFETRLSKDEYNLTGGNLLFDMLQNFKEYIGDENKDLLLGLIPQYVCDFKDYNLWLNKIVQLKSLPKGVKILTVDHITKGYLDDVFINNVENVITLEPGNMDLFGAMKKIATQGNPNDPQVRMRKIMFEMSDAVVKNQKERLDNLGEELIKVGQRSSQKSFFASVFLIYSGFLMQFKDTDKIDMLLDRAIKIAKSGLPGECDCIPVIIQLFAFKGSNFALSKEFEKTIEWYKIQAKFCIENNFQSMAISAYKNALIIAGKNNLDEEYNNCLKAGFDLGITMNNEELKQTEYGFIAFHYYRMLKENKDPIADNIKERMITVFGPDWEESTDKTDQQMNSRKLAEI